MRKINVLSKQTAQLIAAGEVVERPGSVFKELLENAIDSGATQIVAEIKNGGIKLIKISDNGCGIYKDDVKNAFLRHATSKLKTADDLENISSLGFRGEALASICAVSKLEIITKSCEEDIGSRFFVNAGVPGEFSEAGCANGTTIIVRDLFYNVPARMKFLKKDVSEGTFVADVVLHAALSHPEISFRFIREGKQQFVTPGDGVLRSAAYAALGRDFSRDLVETEHTVGAYRVHGLITPPRACRASRGAQYFYINGRYVKNRTMMAAMENAYKGTLMQGKFPGGILCLEMPADLVDVNVHPAKTEVRFAREGEVFDAVYSAVKQALAAPGTGECRFDPEEKPAANSGLSALRPAAGPAPQQAAAPRQTEKAGGFVSMSAQEYRQKVMGVPAAQPPKPAPTVTEVYSPLLGGKLRSPLITELEGGEPPVMPGRPAASLPEEPDLTIYPELPPEPPRQAAAAPVPQPEETPAPQPEAKPEPVFAQPDSGEQTTLLPEPENEPLRYVGEVFRTYIITERGSELCLIDKHAAHERILFEKLAADYGNVASQMLLVPLQIELSAAEKQGVLQNEALLRDAGVEVEDFGGNTVLLRGVPADVAVENAEDMLVELAAKLAQGSKDALTERTEWVLHSIACRAAIKAGDRSSPEQLLHLAGQILSGEVPPFCPHGRPVVLKLTRKELEKRFGRIV